ncbi:MAG: AraC family transcriptional regulator [Bacteroidales bacterium]|nr:AraC family transcriptional regulator [Bacteroidales bacterium]
MEEKEPEIQSIDHLRLLLLSIGLARHNGDWNWKNVNSPFARLYYVVEGNAQIILPSGEYDLSPGRMYYIPAYTTHSYRCTGVFTHYYLHIYEDLQMHDASLLEKFDFPIEILPEPMDLQLIMRLHSLNPTMQLPQSNPLSYDNSKTLHENILRNKHRQLSIRVESRGILFLLMSRFLSQATPKKLATDNRVQKALDYIQTHLSKPLTIEELADMACLSKDHLTRLFKKEMGMPPLHYINQKKVERAQLLLLTEDTPIKTIAYQLGYEDPSYFNRIFRKYTGQTPAEYQASNE